MKQDKEKDNLTRHSSLYDALSRAHLYYYSWKGLHNPAYNKLYKHYATFWSATFHSLSYAWHMELSKIYERKGKKYITFSNVASYQGDEVRRKKALDLLQSKKEVIDNLLHWRHLKYAHNPEKVLLGRIELESLFKLTYGEIEDLLKTGVALLSLLHPEESQGYLYTHLIDDAALTAKEVVEALARGILNERKARRQGSATFLYPGSSAPIDWDAL